MSKIGMRPISTGSVEVSVNGSLLSFKKGNVSENYELPFNLEAVVDGDKVTIKLREDADKNKLNKELWGLHRALIANRIKGLGEGFTSVVRMVGLAYKAVVQGDKLVLSLGFSHKVEIPLEKGVELEIDKTAQILTIKSNDKFLLGNFCSKIRRLKGRDPYKATGIFVNNETLIRKAGKSKS